MKGLLFGTGGVPLSAPEPRSAIQGIQRLAEMGLDCLELEFVHGVRMKEETALMVAESAAGKGIVLSAHAPYYINLNSHEPDKVRDSQTRLLQTVHVASLCGAISVVFHTAFYMDDSPEDAYKMVKKGLKEVLDRIRPEDREVRLRPEVLGRVTQFGTLEEILNLCGELENVSPCIDFAHNHSRTGKANSYDEFASALGQVEKVLGKDALKEIHLHVSGIQYSSKGEQKHLNLKDSDFKYPELLQALRDRNAEGVVICESPNLEDDAHLMKTFYNGIRKR